MKKFVKILAVVAIICFFVYFAYFMYGVFGNGYSADLETCKQYMWIFKDSYKANLVNPHEKFLCLSEVGKRDIYNGFHYYKVHKMYPISVWEFKDLSKVDLSKIVINQNVDLDNVKFLSEVILNYGGSMPVTVKHGFSFQKTISINLDSYSKIKETFEGHNYKGFYGTINKMSFNNEKGEPQIVFDYIDESFSPTVFLLYKGHKSFYVIIINAQQPFKDASIVNILNLK